MIWRLDLREMYRHWNYTTACCFLHKTKCELCPNEIVCSKINKPVGDYYIHPIKYATLKTYANIGVKGLDKFLGKEEKNEIRKDY